MLLAYTVVRTPMIMRAIMRQARRVLTSHVGEAGETPARLNDTALHPSSCDACSTAGHGMSVPATAQWHQCTDTSSRLPCTTRNPSRGASGTHWMPREDVVPSAALNHTIFLTGARQNQTTNVPDSAQWHQCAEQSTRSPCAPRNSPRASGMCRLPFEAVAPRRAPTGTGFPTGAHVEHESMDAPHGSIVQGSWHTVHRMHMRHLRAWLHARRVAGLECNVHARGMTMHA